MHFSHLCVNISLSCTTVLRKGEPTMHREKRKDIEKQKRSEEAMKKVKIIV